ncbi:hypothetical protein BsWGS_24851 [Bradybaena similaris]
METLNGQTNNPASKNFEGHNNILDPYIARPHIHPSFTEATTAPSTSASPSVESRASAASDTAADSTASIRDYKRKHDSRGYEITEASPATEECIQQNETSKILDTSSTDSRKAKKTVTIKNADSSTAAEATPELLSIPQTNFAIGLLVMCCFNPPFGILALYCSLKAAAAYRDGDKIRGAWFARTSIVVSLLGIMITMVIITSVVLCIAVNKNNARKATRSSNALGF